MRLVAGRCMGPVGMRKSEMSQRAPGARVGAMRADEDVEFRLGEAVEEEVGDDEIVGGCGVLWIF